MVDEIYPLYLNVFARSPLQFEKLTKEFLAEIGARMPDKTLFFVWRVAFKLHLYYRVFNDVVEWAIANGYREFHSGSLNYDPKWHLRESLDPIDLYVRRISPPINAAPAPAAAARANSRRSYSAKL